MATTDWTFGGTWPYEPRWFEHADGKLHYVDEGPRDGKPVVMVHGNPTWGVPLSQFHTAAGGRGISLHRARPFGLRAVGQAGPSGALPSAATCRTARGAVGIA